MFELTSQAARRERAASQTSERIGLFAQERFSSATTTRIPESTPAGGRNL